MSENPNLEHILSYFDNLCESGKPLVWISTISPDGKPHMAPVCFVKPLGTDRIAIGAVFVERTVRNMLYNKEVALASARFDQGYDGYMIKGKAEVKANGDDFEKMKGLITAQTSGKRLAKRLIIVTIESIYSLKPREGKKKIDHQK